ncbi:MAG: biotin/lipoate A/B protein ligase family protein [Candidatus Lokiarchaeia archaeon]
MSKSEIWKRVDGKTSWEEDEIPYARMHTTFPEYMIRSAAFLFSDIEGWPGTLVTWSTWAKSCALFTVPSSPDYDIDLDYVIKNDVAIPFRTPAGGGVGWYDNGCSIMGIAFKRDHPKCPSTIEELYRELYTAYAATIGRELGLKTRFKPLNDIEIYCDDGVWRKINTAGGLPSPTYLAAGATIQMTELPWDIIDRVIIPPPEKFADKETKTLRDRSTCLNKETGREVTPKELEKILKKAIEEKYDATLIPTELNYEKIPMYAIIKGMLTSDDWFYNRSEKSKFKDTPITSGVKRGEARVKIPQGPLIRAVVLTKGNEIYNILITGSLHMDPLMPETPIHAMERELQNSPIDKGIIRERVKKIFDTEGYQIFNTTVDYFTDLVMEACQIAQ